MNPKKTLLGRANRYVYPVWARGELRGGTSAEERAERLFHTLLQSPIETLDITPAPALWGRFLRETANALQVAVASPVNWLVHAPDARIAANLVQSHIVEVLCAIGRPQIDYYFLSLREPLSEAQLSGALEALEVARQEGQIGILGLAAWGNPLTVLASWRTHDAFEVVLLPDSAEATETLLPEARARRAGVVLHTVSTHPTALQQGVQVVLTRIEQAVPWASSAD
jgi:aryl-alcohol dehydrogenase-like predicted oxidoreductase